MKFFALILLGLSLPALASTTPEEAASAFLNARISKGSLGAPGGMELADYSPYFSPEMVCLLGAARRFNDKHEQAKGTETTPSSPFASGDLYSGSAAMPLSFKLGTARIRGSQASLPVSFETLAADGSTSTRESTLVMNNQKRRWVIADIEFGAEPETPPRDLKLLAGLRGVLEQTSPDIGWDAKELAGCPKGNELSRLKAEQQRKEARARAKAKANTKKKAADAKKTASSAKKTSPKQAAPNK